MFVSAIFDGFYSFFIWYGFLYIFSIKKDIFNTVIYFLAFDNGRVTQRSSFAHFYVDVEDVDDNDPYFKQAHYTFPLDETITQVESQVLVGQVTAIDDDRDSENKAIQ